MGQNTWQLRHLRSSSPQVIRAEIAQIELGDIERNARSHETAPTGVERVQQQSYRVPVGRHNQWLCVPMIVARIGVRAVSVAYSEACRPPS